MCNHMPKQNGAKKASTPSFQFSIMCKDTPNIPSLFLFCFIHVTSKTKQNKQTNKNKQHITVFVVSLLVQIVQ